MRNLWLKLCLGALFCPLALVPALAGRGDAKLRETIDAMTAVLVEATLNGDVDTSMSYYADGAVSFPAYHGILEGKKAIREYQENMFKVGVKFEVFEFKTLELWKSGDKVYETGTYKLTLTMPGQPGPVDDHGKYMTIYQRQKGGGLKIWREIWNSDINPWAAMGAMDHQGLSEEDASQCKKLLEARDDIYGMVQNLKERAYIGLDGEWDEALSGYRVNGFAGGSHAEEAGVLAGDVLVKVNGIPLTDQQGSAKDAPNRVPGREAAITVLRDGAEKTMNVKLMGATRDIVADTIGEYVLDNYVK
jgi:ketosteroid isomerase-like protein